MNYYYLLVSILWAWLRFSMWWAKCSIITVPLFQDVSKSTSKPEESVVEGKSLVIFCLVIMRGKSMVANTRHWPNAGLMLGDVGDGGPALTQHRVYVSWPSSLPQSSSSLPQSSSALTFSHTRADKRTINHCTITSHSANVSSFWHRWCKSDHALSVIVFWCFCGSHVWSSDN